MPSVAGKGARSECHRTLSRLPIDPEETPHCRSHGPFLTLIETEKKEPFTGNRAYRSRESGVRAKDSDFGAIRSKPQRPAKRNLQLLPSLLQFFSEKDIWPDRRRSTANAAGSKSAAPRILLNASRWTRKNGRRFISGSGFVLLPGRSGSRRSPGGNRARKEAHQGIHFAIIPIKWVTGSEVDHVIGTGRSRGGGLELIFRGYFRSGFRLLDPQFLPEAFPLRAFVPAILLVAR